MGYYLAGLRDLFEMLWNREGVLRRNREPIPDRMPEPHELSFRR